METTIIQQDTRINLRSLKTKTVHLAILGHGNVGGHLLEQIFEAKNWIEERKQISLKIVAIANSKELYLDNNGLSETWRSHSPTIEGQWFLDDLLHHAKEHELGNLIAVDNTASEELVCEYPKLIASGFNLISSNKIGNTIDLGYYKELRDLLALHGKEYLYETNVGAGLPLIDTIKLLHNSGENITRIRGIFSGSLSYIFNTFSREDKAFSEIILEAMKLGLTEPDPRDDLSGKDVGRKLLILARELDLHHELEHVKILDLVPEEYHSMEIDDFLEKLDELDDIFDWVKKGLAVGQTLRYVADLHGDLAQNDGGTLEVGLQTLEAHDALSRVAGSDSVFEIYTENYGKNPIVIKGAGAGGAVTARGVLGDILRLSERL